MPNVKHYIFPTVAQADAFSQDLIQQGLVAPEVGQTSFRRRSAVTESVSHPVTETQTVVTEIRDGGGDADDIAAGAVKGTAVGAVAGAAVGAAAVALTGGLALVPVLLGMGALGSAVGAAAGAADGAVHGDGLTHRSETQSTQRRYEEHYDLDDHDYDSIHTALGTEGRLVAVEDSVDTAAADATAARHGGHRR